MTKSKLNKRALLASVLSLMLCAAMLVGSTFAWFTDSVTSGKNQIVAGNLDVELEYLDAAGVWQPVDPNASLFLPAGSTKWEPGHTEYARLRIRNAGSLALTYKFTANVFGDDAGTTEEKQYTNQNGEQFKLSDYLVFSRTDGAVTDRESLWIADEAAEKALMGTKAFEQVNMEDAPLLPGDSKEFTLAVYMPTWVGDEANQLTSAKATEGEPTIFLGLNLVATQTPHEADSFGTDYDENAEYPADEVDKTFTVTYKTNADAELGTVSYVAGEANSVPADTAEFVEHFADFVRKVRAVPGQAVHVGMTYWWDKDFTEPATQLNGEAGQNYTVYVKLSNNARVQSFTCGDQTFTAPYAESYNITISGGSSWAPYGYFAMSDYYAESVAGDAKWIFTLEKQGEDGNWTALDDSYYIDAEGYVWDNFLWFKGATDSGTYRIGTVAVVLRDVDGMPLYYDYVETPNSIFTINIT